MKNIETASEELDFFVEISQAYIGFYESEELLQKWKALSEDTEITQLEIDIQENLKQDVISGTYKAHYKSLISFINASFDFMEKRKENLVNRLEDMVKRYEEIEGGEK